MTVLAGCFSSISNEERSEIVEALVLSHLDSIYVWIGRHGNEGEQRVIIVHAERVNNNVREAVRSHLREPFVALRSYFSEIEDVYRAVNPNDGKAISGYRDVEGSIHWCSREDISG